MLSGSVSKGKRTESVGTRFLNIGSTMTWTANATKILSILKKTYPDAHCELNFSNPLELMVATILSAQCTDVRVNLVTKDLFRKYRKAEDYAEASVEDLDRDIRKINFHGNKAKAIKEACRM